jgi:hypothetical protein
MGHACTPDDFPRSPESVEEHSTMSNTGTAENEAASSRWATGFSH